MNRPVVLAVLGTRPEAIKLAPVVARLQREPELDVRLVVTGQHREIADEVLSAFGLKPWADMDLLRHGQGLNDMTARALSGLEQIYDDLRPDLVLVQGDTTTAFAAGLAAFHRHIPVGHVEAGLRTGDVERPWPEEANRKLISVVGAMHFAPTSWAKLNLLDEQVPEASITITGNTVVDALLTLAPKTDDVSDPVLRRAIASKRLVLVTTHRRENWGEPQRGIADTVRRIAIKHPDATFLVPLHPNPIVREALTPPLAGLANVILCEPIGYRDMLVVLRRSYMAVSDSGGIQEEGAVLGTPVLVLRDVTERPEARLVGVVRIVGTSPVRLFAEMDRMLADSAVRDRAAKPTGVFGDGKAAERITAAIKKRFGLSQNPVEEFGAQELQMTKEVTA